ncbi:MAG: hemerythrin domain-containing protein [Rhodocyclales bacterium GT-UBC]|nr:MAG: hemerythrin domain-containing protein [Rhodocyclales bacterium GT-UBC]
MKRHPALQQLSREHHTALKLCRQARLAIAQATQNEIAACAETICRLFPHELNPHFLAEEGDLLPALSAAGESRLVNRTLAEHVELRRLVKLLGQTADRPTLQAFATLLEEHVRFEERILFEMAQQRLFDEK